MLISHPVDKGPLAVISAIRGGVHKLQMLDCAPPFATRLHPSLLKRLKAEAKLFPREQAIPCDFFDVTTANCQILDEDPDGDENSVTVSSETEK